MRLFARRDAAAQGEPLLSEHAELDVDSPALRGALAAVATGFASFPRARL